MGTAIGTMPPISAAPTTSALPPIPIGPNSQKRQPRLLLLARRSQYSNSPHYLLYPRPPLLRCLYPSHRWDRAWAIRP
jgi:hypothetical protein